MRSPWGSDFTGDILLREREVQTLILPHFQVPSQLNDPCLAFVKERKKTNALCSAHSPETHLSLFAFGWAQKWYSATLTSSALTPSYTMYTWRSEIYRVTYISSLLGFIVLYSCNNAINILVIFFFLFITSG